MPQPVNQEGVVRENSFVENYYANRIQPHRNQTDDPKFRDKEQLLLSCKERAGDTFSGVHPLNIAVIGPPGGGKSSFLNTVFASFNMDSWRQIAMHGNFGGGGRQVTTRFRSYQKKAYYRIHDNVLMPTFLDMTGFEDDSSEIGKALLRLVFSGRISEDESLLRARNYAGYYGADGLMKNYNKFWKKYFNKFPVDRIIVVCSPNSPLPENFLEAVTQVAAEMSDIPVYGVLTYRDKFQSNNTDPTIQRRVDSFINKLGLPGNRFAHIMNYCDDVDKQQFYLNTCIPSLDVPILSLMQQVLTPNYRDRKKGTDWLMIFVFVVAVLACLFVFCC